MKITFYGNSDKATKVTVTSDKLLRIKDCTVDSIKMLPFKTKIRGIGSWDNVESSRTLYGYYVNVRFEGGNDYLMRYKNEEIVEKLIESIRKKEFKKNVTYKDGKQSKVEIIYNLGNIGQVSRDETEEVLAEEAIGGVNETSEPHQIISPEGKGPTPATAFERADGTREWWLNGDLHREDGPAIERANGTTQWFLNGKLHRKYGPAIEDADGTRHWYLNGKRHRENGPALEWADGTGSWYLNDKLHREGGPALEGTDGSRYWYLNGDLHREDGPAVEGADGTRKWYLNGKLHREDGPAVERADGTREWYLNGQPQREEVSVKGESVN
jgi:hypothetical protein